MNHGEFFGVYNNYDNLETKNSIVHQIAEFKWLIFHKPESAMKTLINFKSLVFGKVKNCFEFLRSKK